jgi:hypothetical protein
LWGTSDELEKKLSGPKQPPGAGAMSMLTPPHFFKISKTIQATADI